MMPKVMMNMAMTLDGKVSSNRREPSSFTSSEDRERLIHIRSYCDALVVGATTARDYETMGISSRKLREARRRRCQEEHPVRVIVSGGLRLSKNLRVLKKKISPLVLVCTARAPEGRRKFFSRYGRVCVCGKEEVDLKEMIRILERDYGVKTLLCEGGPTLNDAFFRADLVDELYLTLCPRIFGGRQAPTLVDGVGVTRLREMNRGKLISLKKGKSEYFLKYVF